MNYCEGQIHMFWKSDTFDQWLFLDAGTAFGYVFDTYIGNAIYFFNERSKKTGTTYGKLCIYAIQLHIRKNSDYTVDSILKCARQYIADLIQELKSNGILESNEENVYSYFT